MNIRNLSIKSMGIWMLIAFGIVAVAATYIAHLQSNDQLGFKVL